MMYAKKIKVTVKGVANGNILLCGRCANISDVASITIDSEGKIISYGLEKFKYQEDYPFDEFNCSEDYFEEGALQPPTDLELVRIYKCKVCGWSFLYSSGSEAGWKSPVGKMRDHVHLKHRN